MLRFVIKKGLPFDNPSLLTQRHDSIDEKFLGEVNITDDVGSVASISHHPCILLFGTFLNATVCFFET